MSKENFDIKKASREFIQTFETGDHEQMQDLMAEDVQSFITNAEGGVNLLNGRDEFMNNIKTLDVRNVKPKVRITQMLPIKKDQIMVMVEVKAHRKGKSLHNFAAYLINFKDGLISEMRMVEALPAYSDEFWKS